MALIKIQIGGSKTPVSLDTQDMLAAGSAGEIYPLRDSAGKITQVVKLFKGPDHVAYAGTSATDKSNRQVAHERMLLMDAKLRAYPKGMPANVLAPKELVFFPRKPEVVGFTMDYLEDGVSLETLADRNNAPALGYDLPALLNTMATSVSTLDQIHALGDCAVGDLNIFNQLAKDQRVYFLDADSFEFLDAANGTLFECPEYTLLYTDPLLLEVDNNGEVVRKKGKRYSKGSDYYSLAMLIWEVITGANLYQGVYDSKPGEQHIPFEYYPVRGLSLLHPRVQTPAYGTPLHELPQVFVDYYRRIVVDHLRERFPRDVLMSFVQQVPLAVLPVIAAGVQIAQGRQTVHGRVRAVELFTTKGTVLAVRVVQGNVLYLYHENGVLVREDGQQLLEVALSPTLRYDITSGVTLVMVGQQAFLIPKFGQPRAIQADCSVHGLPAIQLDSDGAVYLEANVPNYLPMSGPAKPRKYQTLGQSNTRVFADRGRLLTWTSLRHGRLVYLYNLSTGNCYPVRLPPTEGELTDIRVTFGNKSVWLFLTMRNAGKTTNWCFAIDAQGNLCASGWEHANAATWLGRIGGACVNVDLGASGVEKLYAPTDEGVEIIQVQGQQLTSLGVVGDTKGLVTSASRLCYLRPQAVLAWNHGKIVELEWT